MIRLLRIERNSRRVAGRSNVGECQVLPIWRMLWFTLTVGLVSFLILVRADPVRAGEADVIAVDVSTDGANWRFSVTVEHADEGWDHYADKFDIVGPDGTVYGTRILHHPHVNEQPFTRSLGDVEIPQGISEVTIRAHDSVHGYGGKTMRATLPQR